MKKKKPDYSCYKELDKMLPWDEFLKYIKPYKHIRIGVNTGMNEPFKLLFFKVNKKELTEEVRMSRSDVTFTVMLNPYDATYIGTMFISKVRMTLLDKKLKTNN